nr:MAG TPA: hypothetical protein [Caudoviricetes sp.]
MLQARHLVHHTSIRYTVFLPIYMCMLSQFNNVI